MLVITRLAILHQPSRITMLNFASFTGLVYFIIRLAGRVIIHFFSPHNTIFILITVIMILHKDLPVINQYSSHDRVQITSAGCSILACCNPQT